MSDKLRQDFDIYYLELKNFTGRFKTDSQKIETDKLLSRAGKFGQVEKLKAEHESNINELAERFNTDFDKRVQNLTDRVEGKKRDSVLDSIKKKYSKNEDISSDGINRLLLSEMKANQELMRKSNFQNMLSTADTKQIRTTAQSLNDNQDIERLGWLQELASFRGDDMLSNSLEAQINGVRDANLTDEQKSFKAISERIQKSMKLFNYSIERSKTGVFVDARNDEAPSPS